MPSDDTDPAIVTPRMIYKETRKTGKQVAVLDTRLGRVETKVDDLVPKVEQACEKANGATVGVAELKGEKKGKGKVMRYVWPVVLMVLGSGVTLLVRWLA